MTMAQIGPHSRPHMLAKIDGRTKESRLMAAARAELTAHVGGNPNNVPIPRKPPVYNGMIAPRDSWMMPPPCNEMIPPGAPRLFGRESFFT